MEYDGIERRTGDRRQGDDRRRGGRPPLGPDGPSIVLTVRVPKSWIDALCRAATNARLGPSTFHRQLIEEALRQRNVLPNSQTDPGPGDTETW